MRKHNVSLSAPLSAAIGTQIASGRFKDFSAAIQEAAWNYFIGPPSPFEEYELTPQEVAASADKDLAAIRRLSAAGKLKPFAP